MNTCLYSYRHTTLFHSFAGALLSHWTEPVYFTSIILGSLYHAEHLSRAMYARMGEVPGLPEQYRIHKPILSSVTSPESRQPGKAPNFAVDWTEGDEHVEVINAMHGKDENSLPSKLCKQQMFQLFLSLWGRLPAIVTQDAAKPPALYSEAKMAVLDYQAAKTALYTTFSKAKLGDWIKKPVEQDDFS